MDEQRRELQGQLQRIAVRCLALRRALSGHLRNVAITPLIQAQKKLHGIPETIDQLERSLERQTV
jgi:hypothetical protein